MKGISPIISIIVVLLIAISLSAAAWTYISGYWGGLVGSAMEITSTICQGGTNATMYVHNLGTQRLNLLNGQGLEITRTAPATGTPTLVYYTPTAGYSTSSATLEPGETGRVVDTTCTTTGNQQRCAYNIVETASGRLHQPYTTCSG